MRATVRLVVARTRFHLARLTLAAASLGLLLTASGWVQAWERLIPRHSEWSYLDDGSDPGTAWREPDFEESWPVGRAALGFGGRNRRAAGTVIRDRGMTAYFRHEFELTAEQLSRIEGLRLGVRRDDGVLVWLNGREAYRLGLRPGPVAATHDGHHNHKDTHFFRWFIRSEFLRVGTNVIAVEMHKANERDTSLIFDLELAGSTGEVEIWWGPYLQRGTPHGATIRFRTSIPVGPTLRILSNGREESRQGEVGTNHTFVLDGLDPDTRYDYSIEAEGQPLTTPPERYWFRTHPLPGRERPTRIWVVGDAGNGLFSRVHQVLAAYQIFAAETPTDVWLTLGDNAYRSGTLEEHHHAVFAPFESMLRNTFYWPTIGNHDERSFANGGGPYFDVFTLPSKGESGGVPSGSELYYAFDYGNIHFVALYSGRDGLAAGHPQLEWLERDLEASRAEWTIAFLHNAPYGTGEHDSDVEQESINVRRNALPILERHGVDLVLAGHSHYYQRSLPIRGLYGPSSSWDPAIHLLADDEGVYTKGPAYIILGNSSIREDDPLLTHPAVAYGDPLGLGSLILDVAGQRLEGRYLRSNGTVADRFVILHGPGDGARVIPEGWPLWLLLGLLGAAALGLLVRRARS